ncbi:MAG TPA: PEP-CTERM sorting domain-containing protein [Duganella sp.]|nr:PEP-CTERM sorting domain-containing protein [Duganella sp.]
MKSTTFSTAAALVLMMSASTAMAAAGGNGKGNNGNDKGNNGGTTPVITVPATASCAASNISVAGASCIGFVSGNLNGNKPSLDEINQNLSAWGVHLTAPVASTSMLSGLTGNTIDFKQQLYGDTIVSIHYGNVTDVLGNKLNNVTAFYRFDAGHGAGVDSFTTKFDSLSNATLYSTGVAPAAAVPEPGTYAMMFAGLGLLGLVARRRKQK